MSHHIKKGFTEKLRHTGNKIMLFRIVDNDFLFPFFFLSFSVCKYIKNSFPLPILFPPPPPTSKKSLT